MRSQPFLIAYQLSQLIASGMSSALEYAADRHAVDIGYGCALREVFEAWMIEGHDNPEARGTGLQRIWNDHPPLTKRIQAIERRLAQVTRRSDRADSASPQHERG